MKKLVLIALTIVGATFATSQAQAGISFNIFGGSSHSRGHHYDHAPAPVIVAPHHDVHVRPSYSHHGGHNSHNSHHAYQRPSYGHHTDRHERRDSHHGGSHQVDPHRGETHRGETRRSDSHSNHGRSH